MKKIVLFALAIAAVCTVQVYAKSGDVIGNVYSSDIIAYINDVPVPSYNINGRTVIIPEDLEDYGINCYYNDELRTLLVYMYDTMNPSVQNQVARGTPGRITNKIYETDIKTYVNGELIQAYSLNGKVAVAIENLGKITDDNMEYSPYNMRYVWDGKNRSISLYYIILFV